MAGQVDGALGNLLQDSDFLTPDSRKKGRKKTAFWRKREGCQ